MSPVHLQEQDRTKRSYSSRQPTTCTKPTTNRQKPDKKAGAGRTQRLIPPAIFRWTNELTMSNNPMYTLNCRNRNRKTKSTRPSRAQVATSNDRPTTPQPAQSTSASVMAFPPSSQFTRQAGAGAVPHVRTWGTTYITWTIHDPFQKRNDKIQQHGAIQKPVPVNVLACKCKNRPTAACTRSEDPSRHRR